MSRAASWAGALGALALLTFVCVRCHGPTIEAELAASISAALGGAALGNVEVVLSGRDVTLTGAAADADERARFGALAARVPGVRAVDNRLRVAGEPAPDATAFAVTDGPEGLTVRGTVSDDAARRALQAGLARAFPGRDVTDELTVGPDAAAAWQAPVLGALGALGGLPSGTLRAGTLTAEPDGRGGGAIVLGGRVRDADARAQVEAALQAAIESPWAVRSELAVGNPARAAVVDSAATQVETSAPGNADVSAAQAALQDLFAPEAGSDGSGSGSGAIEFEAGTTRLTDASHDLLIRASGVLRRFGDVTVEVQGHTDDEGSAASNLRLSEQRADAVRRALSDAGVDRTRLTVRGFGETEPVASNDTEPGRARNRRVAFRLGATD